MVTRNDTGTPSQRLDAATAERLREEGRAAVERLAHVPMQLDLTEWSTLSATILAGLGVEPYLAAALATEPHQHGGKGA